MYLMLQFKYQLMNQAKNISPIFAITNWIEKKAMLSSFLSYIEKKSSHAYFTTLKWDNIRAKLILTSRIRRNSVSALMNHEQTRLSKNINLLTLYAGKIFFQNKEYSVIGPML